MSLFSRLSPRRCAGGAIGLLAALAFFSGGAVSMAEPADQAATATPVQSTTSPTQAAAPSCVTATQGIQVLLENPSPGDLLVPGTNVVMAGVAYDPAAQQGTGIDRVAVYLGNRDAGGTFLGNATLGTSSPLAPSGSQFATAGFTLRSLTLPTGTGSRSIFVYAHSAASNKEGVLSVPVFLGVVPTPVKGQVPTAVLPAAPACTPTTVPTAVPTATPLPAATTPPVVFVAPSLPATATPFATLPSVSAPAAVAPVAPVIPPTSAALSSTVPSTAAAPTTATTAPRGGGIPTELGFGLLALGALVLGGGAALRRRERTAPRPEGEPPALV